MSTGADSDSEDDGRASNRGFPIHLGNTKIKSSKPSGNQANNSTKPAANTGGSQGDSQPAKSDKGSESGSKDSGKGK